MSPTLYLRKPGPGGVCCAMAASMKAMGFVSPNATPAPAAPSTRSRRETWNMEFSFYPGAHCEVGKGDRQLPSVGAGSLTAIEQPPDDAWSLSRGCESTRENAGVIQVA